MRDSENSQNFTRKSLYGYVAISRNLHFSNSIFSELIFCQFLCGGVCGGGYTITS